MNLKNLSKDVSQAIFKRGEQLLKKNAVRELEIDEKGNYIAFVDDGDESYDVCLSVEAKSFEISSHSCDCLEKHPFCMHKTAVALHLKTKGSQNKDAIANKIKIKKKDAIDLLVDDIPEHLLRAWLIKTAKSNKEFLFILKSEFDSKPESLTSEQIINKTTEIMKAVAGQTKKVDTGQINKIVQLLNMYHQTFFPDLLIHLNDEKTWDLFHAMLHTTMIKYKTQKSSSTKLIKYIEEIVSKISNAAVYYADEIVETISFNILNRVEKLNESNYIFLPFITSNLEKIKEVSSQKRAVKRLFNYFDFYHNESENIKLLKKVVEIDKLTIHADLFTACTFMNNFNNQLVDALIASDLMERARDVCKKSLDLNYNDKFNYIYIEKMSLIYRQMNDVDNRLQFIKSSITTTYSLSDYLFYLENAKEEKDKVNMEKLMRSRTNSESLSYEQLMFKFALLAHKKKYEEMIALVTLSHPLAVILPYLEELVNFDKNKFLHKLLNAETYRFYIRDLTAEDNEIVIGIFEKYYTMVELRAAYVPENKYHDVNKILGKYLLGNVKSL